MTILSNTKIKKLNSEAVPFNVSDIFSSCSPQQQKLSSYYNNNREANDSLKRLSYISSRVKRVILYLSDNKFHSFDNIIEKCSGYKDTKELHTIQNWNSCLRSLRNKKYGYILDFVKDNHGKQYFRLHPHGTNSEYDSSKNIKKQAYVITRSGIPTGLAFSTYEVAEEYCKSRDNFSFFDISLYNSLNLIN